MRSVILRTLVVLGTLLVLGVVDAAIVGKERIRREGELVYLPLAPVDPRSLVQGDYMALRFALAGDMERRDAADRQTRREGDIAFAPVTLDGKRIASLAAEPASASMKLRYRIRGGHVWLGTSAFFFEEGTSGRFRGARFGEFRVDRRSGEAVLVGLRNEALEPL